MLTDDIAAQVQVGDGSRCLTARARDFTNCYMIMGIDLFKMSELYARAFKAMKKIQKELSEKKYSTVSTTCYLCGSPFHLALGCPRFKSSNSDVKGNLLKMFLEKKLSNLNGKDADIEFTSHLYVQE